MLDGNETAASAKVPELVSIPLPPFLCHTRLRVLQRRGLAKECGKAMSRVPGTDNLERGKALAQSDEVMLGGASLHVSAFISVIGLTGSLGKEYLLGDSNNVQSRADCHPSNRSGALRNS